MLKFHSPGCHIPKTGTFGIQTYSFLGHWIQVSDDDPAGEEPIVTSGKEIRWAHSLSGGRDTLNLFS